MPQELRSEIQRKSELLICPCWSEKKSADEFTGESIFEEDVTQEYPDYINSNDATTTYGNSNEDIIDDENIFKPLRRTETIDRILHQL